VSPIFLVGSSLPCAARRETRMIRYIVEKIFTSAVVTVIVVAMSGLLLVTLYTVRGEEMIQRMLESM
jgi:hypothetical protein